MNNIVDRLLFNASESQLRNVLAVASRSIPTNELVAMFRKEAALSAAEALDESIAS
jgi:hypothetical protein